MTPPIEQSASRTVRLVEPSGSIEEFVFTAALYQKFVLREKTELDSTLLNRGPAIDGYCHKCKSNSIFNRKGTTTSRPANNSIFTLEYVCNRNKDHNIFVFTVINGDNIEKIGQTPSLADIAQKAAAEFIKVLDEIDRVEYSKAIGLAAHGVGIGSFVYLRRVFERLIDRRYQAHSAEVDAVDYQRSRMSEKIGLLADFLPKFLVEHKSIYGILSLGVHELSEEKCRAAFPVMKESIDVILEEDLRIKREADRRASLSKAIHQMNSDLATKP